jgi:hypothetical protein
MIDLTVWFFVIPNENHHESVLSKLSGCVIAQPVQIFGAAYFSAIRTIFSA